MYDLRFTQEVGLSPSNFIFTPNSKPVIPLHNPVRVTILLVAFESHLQTVRLFELIQKITAVYNLDVEILIIDNSTRDYEKNSNKSYFIDSNFNKLFGIKTRYIQNKDNIMLAASFNQAANECDSDLLIFLCSKHSYLYHQDWLKSIVDCMLLYHEDGRVLHGGCLVGHPNSYGDDSMNTHVQGGICVEYVKAIKDNPYTMDWPHKEMDVYRTRWYLNNGYYLIHIPTVLCSPDNWDLSKHNNNQKEPIKYSVHSAHMTYYMG